MYCYIVSYYSSVLKFVSCILVCIQDAAEAIYQRHCSTVTCQLTDNLINYNELARSCRDLCADDKSFDIALMELCRQKKCVIGYDADGEKVCYSVLLR